MPKLSKTILDIDNEKLTCEYALSDINAVILHGAGPATTRQSNYYLADELVKRGIGVILFDFSGHGESSGKLSELSLSRRVKQAIGVIDKLTPPNSPFYLVGFSMSGQTACDLLPIYNDRVKAILLACPAAYTAEVSDLPFGTDTFTNKLREPNSWQNTDAANHLAQFKGRTIIAIGTEDTVIPKGVIQMLKTAANDLTYFEYKGATHHLSAWLTEHPQDLIRLIEQLVRPKG
jgi:pimeloyl-ACP methyl ester carboxylesterase